MIPAICQLAMNRKSELATGDDLDCYRTFEDTRQRLMAWHNDSSSNIHSPQPSLQDDQNPDTFTEAGDEIAGMLMQRALLLFLQEAYYQQASYVQATNQPLIDESIALLRAIQHTSWATNSFWPSIVVGSYGSTREQRDAVVTALLPGTFPIVKRGLQVLRWVWESPDGVCGFDGLARVIEANRTDYCIG